MWRAFFKALFAAILEFLRERKLAQDYEAALKENARRDAEAIRLAGERATRERMNREEAAMGDDPAVLRERMRNRDPATR
jgi:hypothetical protein